MTSVAPPISAVQAVGALRAAIDGLLSVDLTGCDAEAFLASVDALEVQSRRLAAVDARWLAEVDDRRLAGELGRTSVADVLTVRLHVARAEARARVRRAAEIGARRAVTGEALPPLLDEVADAVTRGEISGPHASVIAAILRRVPESLGPEVWQIAHTALLGAARQTDPQTLRQLGEQLLQRILPEKQPDPERRGVTLSPDVAGLAGLSGAMTARCAALWRTLFDTLAAPRPETTTADGTVVRDERSPAQRRHDAMEEIGLRLLRSGVLPDAGGVPATLIVTVGLRELARAGGVVRTSHGELLGVEQVLALAGELGIELCLTDDTPDDTLADEPVADEPVADEPRANEPRANEPTSDEPMPGPDETAPFEAVRRFVTRLFPRRPGRGPVLAYGRARRNATGTQRKVIAGRDGAGCSFPGCTRPLAWTQAHHVVRWEDGGRTDIDNMCLVCVFHHQLLDRGDWSVRMADDGRPEWIPPRLLDPQRRPLRNYAHHPPDVRFGPVLVRLS
ncbi:HNH endonuclease signature motif containing protein [Jatrophihabitans fulvus]